AQHQLHDDVRDDVSVQRRQYCDGRNVEQPDGHLHAAVRPLEPDGRLLTSDALQSTRAPGDANGCAWRANFALLARGWPLPHGGKLLLAFVLLLEVGENASQRRDDALALSP